MDDMFEYPIDGTLDLHMFRPGEAKSAIEDYLTECRLRGILHVRIIHGKGQGVLREMVRSYLKKCPFVKEFSTPADSSGWGATIALLEPLDTTDDGKTTDE